MAADREWSSEQPARRGEIAFGEQLADARTRNAFAVRTDRSDRFRDESFGLSDAIEQRHIAAARMAEPEIFADPDFFRAQSRNEHARDEIFSADIAAIAALKRSSSTRSIPASISRPTFSTAEVNCGTTASRAKNTRGIGSKLTATASRFNAAARSRT